MRDTLVVMKLTELSRRRRGRTAPLRQRILQHLDAHPDEVFSYRDEALAAAVDAKVSAASFTLWALHRDGLIDKEEVDGKMYFGSRRAVGLLRSQLGMEEPDPFRRAQANRAKIAGRGAKVGALELLDSVRGPWE